VVAVADDRDANRGSGRQEPSLRLVPGPQGSEPSAVSDLEPSAHGEPHLRTFLIADVRGYTTFTAIRGDEAAAALAARFAEVTRAVVAEHSGRLVELRGDEALVVFTSARSAIRAALALRDRLVTETLADPSLPLPVGIGLDAGEAVEVEGGYRGGALNLAARLCSAAAPGEVLASREVTHLARHVEGAHYVERGRMQFKGLADPVPVVQVLPDNVDPGRQAAFHAAIAAPRAARGPSAKLLVAAALTLVVLAVAGTYGIVRVTRQSMELSTENRLDVIDLGSGNVIEQVLLSQQPSGVAASDAALWVTNAVAGTVSRLDLDSHQVQQTVDVGGEPSGVVVAGGFVWVSVADLGSVAQISPDVNKVVNTVPVGNQPTGIAAGKGAVWVANSTDRTVSRIDTTSGRVTGTVDVGGAPTGVAVTADTVWVTNNEEGTVSAIDPGSATLRNNYPVGGGPTGIASAAGAIWVANNLDGALARLDPNTGVVTTIPVGNGPSGVVAAGGKLWVSNEYGAELVRVDARTSKVDRTLKVGGTPHGLVAAGGNLWVTAAVSGNSHRGGTLTVLGEIFGELQSIDPNSYDSQVMRIAYDGLVGIRRAAGAAGTTLVPNLATALPSPVDGGKTYAFRLRKGIRYSTGRPVRASDIRRAIERSENPPNGMFSGIRGASACPSSGSCDLSAGIQTDDATGSVTFRLLKPDPEFLYKLSLPLASAVPPGTTHARIGLDPIPATGPYMIAEFDPGVALEMVRNPYFREWSRAAKPDGYPDRIVFRAVEHSDAAHDAAVTQVLRGKADLTFGPFSDRMSELKTRYAGQLHLNPSANLFIMALTTTAPPFDDERARQALNYAVDRGELVTAWGGTDTFQVSCQVLPPGFPGYAPYCPYATDLVRARQLVAQSGTKGDRVTISMAPSRRAVGEYLERVLTELGYQARLDVPATNDDYYRSIWETGQQRAEAIEVGWGPNYPAASNFLQELFSCHSVNPRPFCDPGVQAHIQSALALQQTQPAAAGREWQQADRGVVDRAGLLSLGFPLDAVVTSRRVGNFLHQPGHSVLVDQLWVRPSKP
jgi:YVTN family beta-propeller protein